MIEKYKHDSILSQKGLAIWFTGLSGAGKSTLAVGFEGILKSKGYTTKILDGDVLRNGINAGLGFSQSDRIENIRRAAEVAKLFVESNIITICSFITPTEEMRNIAKTIIGKDNFIEIFIDCSIELCEKRDVKGLYKKARAGTVENFTGISSSFETPKNSDLIINTESNSIDHCLKSILEFINLD